MLDPTPSPDKRPDVFTKAWWKMFVKLNAVQFIGWLILAVSTALLNWANGTNNPIPNPPLPIFPEEPFGWIPPSEKEKQLAQAQFGTLDDKDAGQADVRADQSILAWKLFEKATGQRYPARDQSQIGSCVSFGTSGAGEMTIAANIALKRGKPQQYVDFCREAIYGGSRINADPRNPIRSGDGSTGERAAKWFGMAGAVTVQHQYQAKAVGPYTVSRCREWGSRGCPVELAQVAKDNPVHVTLVTSADAAIKALGQGYFVYVCSDIGFGDLNRGPLHRDAEGFLRPSGSWPHCMFIAGYRADRAGFLIVNSWGARWVDGPKGPWDDIPDGSFWADAQTVDRMLSQRDSYAVDSVGGFKRRKIDPNEWIVQSKLTPNCPRELTHAIFLLAP